MTTTLNSNSYNRNCFVNVGWEAVLAVIVQNISLYTNLRRHFRIVQQHPGISGNLSRGNGSRDSINRAQGLRSPLKALPFKVSRRWRLKNKSLLILVLSARTITFTPFNISIHLWNPKQLSLYCNVLVLLYLAVLLEKYAEMKNIVKSKYSIFNLEIFWK